MFVSKLVLAAAVIRLLQAQENGPEYVNVIATAPPEGFVHPEIGAGINDGLCSSCFPLTAGRSSIGRLDVRYFPVNLA
jgi:hypothetical protein